MNVGGRAGILIGDELASPASENITVVNNLLYGNYINFSWWQYHSGGMHSYLIANNTMVNAHSGPNIRINSEIHDNTRIQNNIVVQDDTQELINFATPRDGVIFGHNLWSKLPPAYAVARGDVVGDPLLMRINLATADWFKLQPASPAIGRALKLAEVIVDFFGTLRNVAPDIGGVEYVFTAPPMVMFKRTTTPARVGACGEKKYFRVQNPFASR
jgi:hypothetical protein